MEKLYIGEGMENTSNTSVASVCSNISQFISEEDLIDTLFCACDTNKSGKVPVSSILDYIKSTQNSDEEEENSDLEDLWFMFDTNGQDISVDVIRCREVMTRWVSRIRRTSVYKFNSPNLDRDLIEFSPHVQKRLSQSNEKVFSTPILKSLDTSKGTAEAECVFESLGTYGGENSLRNVELLTEISELQFEKKKLQSQLLESQTQATLADELNVQLQTEKDELRKNLSNLQKVVERDRELTKELTDLKIHVSTLESTSLAEKAKYNRVEKVCESRINELKKDLTLLCTELDDVKVEKRKLGNTIDLLKRQLEILEVEEEKHKQAEILIQELRVKLRDAEISALTSCRCRKRCCYALGMNEMFPFDAELMKPAEEITFTSIHDEIMNLPEENVIGHRTPFCEKNCSRLNVSKIPAGDPRISVNFIVQEGDQDGPKLLPQSSQGDHLRWDSGVNEVASHGDSSQTFSAGALINQFPSSIAASETNNIVDACHQLYSTFSWWLDLLARHSRNVDAENSRIGTVARPSNRSTSRPIFSPEEDAAIRDQLFSKTATPAQTAPSEHTQFLTQQYMERESTLRRDLLGDFCSDSVENCCYPDSRGELMTDAERELNREELLNRLRELFSQVEAIISTLVGYFPSVPRMTEGGHLRPEHVHVLPNAAARMLHECNDTSLDSGIPSEFDSAFTSEPTFRSSSSNKMWSLGRHLKPTLLPIQTRSLDQGHCSTASTAGDDHYCRRSLSCPVLQSRVIVVSKGVQTDLSWHPLANIAIDGNMLSKCQPTAIDALSVDLNHNLTCHKLPVVREEEHEDPQSPLLLDPTASHLRCSSRLSISLRPAPPPYRPPPPVSPYKHSSVVGNLSSENAAVEISNSSQTPRSSVGSFAVDSSRMVLSERRFTNDCSTDDRPKILGPKTAVRNDPQPTTSDSRKDDPGYVQRRNRSVKRRLGVKGCTTLIKRCTAVELDEFDVEDTSSSSIRRCPPSSSNASILPIESSGGHSDDRRDGAVVCTDPDMASTPVNAELRESDKSAQHIQYDLLASNYSFKNGKSRSSRTDSLSEQELEDEFQRLSLAIRMDESTIDRRLELHQRQRNLAEENMENELRILKSILNDVQAKSETFSDAEVRRSLVQLQQQVDVIRGIMARVSDRAEAYGAIQQEDRVCRDVAIMVKHVENVKRLCSRVENDLEEARQLNKRLMDESLMRQQTLAGGISPKSIFLNVRPTLNRRRASLAVDFDASHVGMQGWCTCPKVVGDAQGTIGVNRQCPLHSIRLKSGRRSSVCAALLPISPTNESKATTASILESEKPGNDTDAIQENLLDGEPERASSLDTIETPDVETSHRITDESDENNVENNELPLDDELESFEFSSILSRLDITASLLGSNLADKNDEDDDSVGLLQETTLSEETNTSNHLFLHFHQRWWHEAEISMSIRYALGGILLLAAVFCLLSSFLPLVCLVMPVSAECIYVRNGWISWEELLKPYWIVRHHSPPPI